MKYVFLFLGVSLFSLKSHSQEQDKLFMGFFVNDFVNDSVHVFLNKKKIMAVMLNTVPSVGRCQEFIMIQKSDSVQCLTFLEIATKKKFQTVIKKEFKYLYIFKVDKGEYRFDYSNKLVLPQ